MRLPVAEAARRLEERGMLQRRRTGNAEIVIDYVRELVGRALPEDLVDFYREEIDCIGQFDAIRPVWNDYVGWRTPDEWITELLPARAVPLFTDGCGSRFGLDLTPGVQTPAVYFFDHADSYERAAYAAGSSLGTFLLLLADHDRALHEDWPPKWELAIDPDLERCPRAPAIWDAG